VSATDESQKGSPTATNKAPDGDSFCAHACSPHATGLATHRDSRSKSVLAHRSLATAGLGIALGRHCDRGLDAGAVVKAFVTGAVADR
jgi:hypothetical protein